MTLTSPGLDEQKQVGERVPDDLTPHDRSVDPRPLVARLLEDVCSVRMCCLMAFHGAVFLSATAAVRRVYHPAVKRGIRRGLAQHARQHSVATTDALLHSLFDGDLSVAMTGNLVMSATHSLIGCLGHYYCWCAHGRTVAQTPHGLYYRMHVSDHVMGDHLIAYFAVDTLYLLKYEPANTAMFFHHLFGLLSVIPGRLSYVHVSIVFAYLCLCD